MKNHLLTSIALGGLLISAGCATKKYVAQTTDPIKDRLNTVSSQTDKNGQDISQQGDELKKQSAELDKTNTELAANKERAQAADSRATDALNKAGEAANKADQNGRDLGELRQVVANLDDYKPAGSTVVPFGFNKDTLTPQAREELDKLVADKTTLKRYFIAVEGFTDKVGTTAYNNALSKRRADQVVQYLVAKHDIPVYRIHEIGMGKEKPADEGRGRTANAKNRRVEVTFYSADNAATAMSSNGGGSATR